MIKTIDITKAVNDVYDIPCCPLCDQPISEYDEVSIGQYHISGSISASEGFYSFCLIHEECGKSLDE